MRTIVLATATMLGILLLSGCDGIGQTASFKTISVDEASAKLKANPRAKTVDVRSEAEYREGHLEGAIVIPLDQFRAKAESLLKRDEEILIYCHDGPMGIDAANLRGGIRQWQRQGLPIVK